MAHDRSASGTRRYLCCTETVTSTRMRLGPRLARCRLTLPAVPEPRFLTLNQVAEELAVSHAQAYALVRTGEIPAIKLGGRGQWRVERDRLEEFIQRLYAETQAFVREHPWPAERGGTDEVDETED